MKGALIIGFGRMGISHASLYRLHPQNRKKIIDVLDTSKKLNFALKFFKKNTFLQPKDLKKIKINEYDSIFICSPPEYHQESIKLIRGFEGKVFIEKPLLATNFFDLDCKKIYVGYVLRKSKLIEDLKKIVSKRKISKCYIRLETNFNFSTNGNSWRESDLKFGGLINEFGSHCINLGLNFIPDLKLFEASFKNVNNSTLNLNSESNEDLNCYIKLEGNSKKVRKATYNLQIDCSDGESFTTDFYMLKSNGKIPINHSLAEEGISSYAYVRGHEFSSQMKYFLENNYFDNSLSHALKTDLILKTIHEKISPRR